MKLTDDELRRELMMTQQLVRDLTAELARRENGWAAVMLGLNRHVELLTSALQRVERWRGEGVMERASAEELTEYAGALARELRVATTRGARCEALAVRLARLGDATDPGGVADRKTVTLTDLVEQAVEALRVDNQQVETTTEPAEEKETRG